MIILGGSPLGLVGVTTDSRKTTSNKIQYSTFNAGKSRNVNVYQYNSGDGGGQPSLFTGRRKIRPWPNIKMVNVDNTSVSVPDPLGLGDIEKETLYKTQGRKGDSYSRKDLHNNDVYDTSITHLIDKLANTKASLRPADFAYLKDLGVYPNNRLMIARRFLGPIDDNIMVNSGGDVGSLATIVSWMPESEDLFSINFGEVWAEADASFSGIIDGIGNDFKIKGLGEIMGGAGGAIPLPGFTEILQRQLMAKMGIISDGSANTIPSGNPNLIKEAKVRKTIGYDEPGSGLMGKLSFKVTAEYEMKFISGLDPTIVWMDIISNILRFGTSTSINWGLNKSFAAKMKQWINNPGALLNELGKKIREAVTTATGLIQKEAENLKNAFENEQKAGQPESTSDGDEDDDSEENIEAFIKSARKAYDGIINKVIRGLKSVLNGVVSKYKVKAIGVFNALTGSPSTPWHLTIGNPLRPIFCCGDMLTQDVTLTMGSQLAFNDLPSSIKVEFVLTNARNLGLQEIMSKFNSGYLRTVDVQKSFYETNTYQVGDKTFYESPGFYEYENPLGDNVTTTISSDGTPVVASSELASSDGAETVVVEEEKPVKDPSGLREKGNDWYGWDANNNKPYEGMENDLGKEAKKKWDSMSKKKEKKEAVVPKAKAANNGKDKKSKAKAKDKSSKKP